MPPQPDAAVWPELPYAAWKDTAATLHLWTQVVGKIRLALTPWVNHSWHVTLQVSARGLATPLISQDGRDFQIEFDFIDHVLWVRTSDGIVPSAHAEADVRGRVLCRCPAVALPNSGSARDR